VARASRPCTIGSGINADNGGLCVEDAFAPVILPRDGLS
jgi:hypothetical protein